MDINLEKHGFSLKDHSENSSIYELKGSHLYVYSSGGYYTFYSIVDNCRVDHVYMIRLQTDEDVEFVLNNVRDVTGEIKARALT